MTKKKKQLIPVLITRGFEWLPDALNEKMLEENRASINNTILSTLAEALKEKKAKFEKK